MRVSVSIRLYELFYRVNFAVLDTHKDCLFVDYNMETIIGT